MAKGYYHVSSHGLESNDIFKSRRDFVQGMNDIALSVLGFDVCILAFCLMSNHFHFVLYGTLEECRKFALEYKRRCGIRMRITCGEVKGMKDVEMSINFIGSQEYLENVIAYVLRNPIAAGIMIVPYHYMWSSAFLYFGAPIHQGGERLNDMSERKRFSILKSRTSTLPDNYLVDESGMILPSCYVDVQAVERIFRHPARFMVSLARKVENDVEVMMGLAESVSMTDQELLTQMNVLVKLEFCKDSIFQLTMEERMKLCLLLKRNFRAGVKQIARVTRLSSDVVAKIV